MTIKPHPILVESYYKLFAYDKARFLVVGGLGFVVNFLGLTLFFHLFHLPIWVSQILSAELALLATFLGNNFWAFTHHHHLPWGSKLARFHASAIVGILINSACVILLVHSAHTYYGLALVVGSLAGLIWNYTLYKRFVFKKSEI